MNKTTNILVFIALLVLLLILSSSLAFAYDDTEDFEVFNFMKWKGTAQYYRDVYEPESLFYPIEDWERLVCRDDVSTFLAQNDIPMASDGGIYDTTSTVNAYKIYDWNSTDIMYEVSYYFHPTYDRKFTLQLQNNAGTLKYVIVPDMLASSVTGAMGYIAFNTPEEYTKAVLKYDSTTKDYTIINNRNITQP